MVEENFILYLSIKEEYLYRNYWKGEDEINIILVVNLFLKFYFRRFINISEYKL